MQNLILRCFGFLGGLGLLFLPSVASAYLGSASISAALRRSAPTFGGTSVGLRSLPATGLERPVAPAQTAPPPQPNPLPSLPPIDTVQIFVMGGLLVGSLVISVGDMITRQAGGDPLVWQILGLVLNAANIAYSCYAMSQFSLGSDPLYQALFWGSLVMGGVSFLWGVVSLILNRTARSSLVKPPPSQAPTQPNPTTPSNPTAPGTSTPSEPTSIPPSTFSWGVSPWVGISPTTRAAEGGFAFVGEF